MSNRRHTRRCRRRGAMLFEVMLSVGLFVGAGAFCLGVVRSLFTALQRVQTDQRAIDLARSKLAELEAGLIALTDLRGEWSGAIGSYEPAPDTTLSPRGTVWTIEMETTRTEYTGLSLVELTVREAPASSQGPEGRAVTLRQLMTLRELEPEAYEEDELLEGLPEAPEP